MKDKKKVKKCPKMPVFKDSRIKSGVAYITNINLNQQGNILKGNKGIITNTLKA